MQGDNITTKKSKIHGIGIFATRDFKNNETVIHWDPKIINASDEDKLSEIEKQACYHDGNVILVMQGVDKYMNHSCNPNTHVDLENRRDIALREVKAGEEITSDYGKEEMPRPCSCGSKNCRAAGI